MYSLDKSLLDHSGVFYFSFYQRSKIVISIIILTWEEILLILQYHLDG